MQAALNEKTKIPLRDDDRRLLRGRAAAQWGRGGAISHAASYAQATAPLQGSRVATLTISARSPQLPQVPSWLDALRSLPGFVDAVPGSVTLDQQSNTYTVNITMHINQDAYSKRFAGEEKK